MTSKGFIPWIFTAPAVLLLMPRTHERVLHVVVAVVVLFVALRMAGSQMEAPATWRDRALLAGGWAIAAFVLIFGSWLPDLDWTFNAHRSPLTHSVVPVLLTVVVLGAPGSAGAWSGRFFAAFSLGIGSHLLLDVGQPANVVWIPAPFDPWFLGGNGLALLFWSAWLLRRCRVRTGAASRGVVVKPGQ
jgi:hypothetical protein